MTADVERELRAVPAPSDVETPLEAEAEAPRNKPAVPAHKPSFLSKGLIIGLLVALGLLALGYGAESRRASALESQVVGLQSELDSARESLAAQERRMGVVRAHVDDLAARVGLLQEAVSVPAEAAE